RLAGTFSRDRLRCRRNPKAAPQSRAVEGLRRAWCILGLMDRARSCGTSRQYAAVIGLVHGREVVVARSRCLSARGSAGCTQGDRRAASDGKGNLAAVIALSW